MQVRFAFNLHFSRFKKKKKELLAQHQYTLVLIKALY